MYILPPGDFSIGAIAESGQCFRLRPSRESDGLHMPGASAGEPYGREETGVSGLSAEKSLDYELVAFGKVLKLHELSDRSTVLDCDEKEFGLLWKDYFDLDTDYSAYRSLVLPEDSFLREALIFGSGIRILRQEPFETLISFIISQRKSIPAIRTSIERLSESLGEDLGHGRYRFPTPSAIAEASTDILRSAGLGYRLPYVREAAMAVESGRIDLSELSLLNTEDLLTELMKLSGVGLKVASCVALFAYHRLDTVPVDVWMKKVIDTVYGGSLPREYSPCIGLLHQYMFNYARLGKAL